LLEVVMRQSSRIAVAAAAVVSLFTLASPASADDRDLLRDSVGEPYVFILLDTSGSMHWTPTCTAAQLAAGSCSIPCDAGDCYAPLQGDDPSSKFFQAKSALYEVLRDTDDIHFGFATYNQDELYLNAKHWLYKARADGPVIPGWGPFPARNAGDVFGRTWNCDNGNNADDEVGCFSDQPADLSDEFERSRMQRFAKGGLTFGTTVTMYVRAGSTYRVRYEPRSGSYGAPLVVRVVIERCRNTSCSSRDDVGDLDVTFDPIGDFASWDSAPVRAQRQRGYFDQGEAADPVTGNTCSGWDPNTDTNSDKHDGYSTRWPTDSSDARGAAFTVGDVIPLDWQANHKNDILRRLAPNLTLNPIAVPDFRTATYFRDARSGSEDFLRLKNEAARPLVASGSTPLGNSVRAFRTWWAGCPQGSCPKNSGWKDLAAAQDPDWGCRRKFLLILTDGDDTCGGADACSSTASLFAQESVKTYVVAFGVENQGGNKLTCMAANGGSGKPIYPQNKADLVKALKDIFGQIREEASAFASAAVPSVQAEVADRIYLSSFTPLNSQSVWDGHLDAYLKPLPLTADRRPDRNRACPAPGSPNRSSCHLWDAGEVLLGQAPAATDLAGAINESTLKLGLQPDQRRVLYAKSGFSGIVPRTLRLFSPPAGDPATDPEWTDLWNGLNISFADRTAATSRTRTVIARTLQIKESTVDLTGGGTRPIRYVLGDIFHSDPAVVDRPNDFGFFSSNLESRAEACSTDPGYRCFALENARRRKMLVVGSNDGQLHFFDAGVWDATRGQFGDGTGAELFAFIPRPALPLARELAEGSKQIFGLDSTPRLDDVFLDPRHNGTPDRDQREWRTLLVGGFREGGSKDGGTRMIDFVSGYYALDITQPDQFKVNGEPIDRRVVPSCLAADNQPVPGCGPLPFPALLWEFTDSIAGAQLDEDDVNGDGIAEGNNVPDLGQTWSAPTIGRIRVREGTEIVAKFVAIFGGGMDAESKASPRRGNWLYMIDVETGKPIYKQQLTGAAPADPAALDIDLDGFLDVVYAGTTAGFMYKVDLRSIPDLTTLTLRKALAVPDLLVDQQVTRIVDPRWKPFPIFSTFGRPIYFAPTLFYVSKAQRFALAFGTGDREDLWSFNDQEGRFYVILDDNFTASMLSVGDLPKDETEYPAIDPDALNAPSGTDFVLAPSPGKERGWYMRLDPDERVITQAFGLSGVIIFSGFQPQITVDPGPGNGNGGNKAAPVCARGGTSRIFVVLANNGNSLLSTGGVPTRFRTVPEFVTNPYVEQGSTKNPGGSGGPNSEILDQTQTQILGELKKFYPAGTKFANYWISVSGIRSDTGYERYATIPVGIIERNWKEH
jgi:Tfp pilus tip-associated adhesin PilY1